jgi:hypothetical protein
MQFDRDEYAFLSRRGSVPAARRSPRRPVPESEPVLRRDGDRGHARAQAVGRRLESVVSRPASRVRAATSRRVGAADDYRDGVRAMWTAFGSGGQDEFRGR